MMDSRKKKGIFLIILGILVGAVGVLGFMYFIFAGLIGMRDNMTQYIMPGSHEVVLQPGSYTIFHEYRTVVNGVVYNNAQMPSSLSCQLVEDGTGKPVQLLTSGGGSYQFGSRYGSSLMSFEVAHPGKYVLSATYASGGGSAVILTIGKGLKHFAFSTLIPSLASIFGGCGIGGILLVIGIILLATKKKEKRNSAA